jgi:hypothetical protein
VWNLFADQTIAMLKEPISSSLRDPGYFAVDLKSEVYWMRPQKRKHPVEPYRIEIMGATLNTSVAVEPVIVQSVVAI